MLKEQDRTAREEMLDINVRQKEFYESRFEATRKGSKTPERAANWATNLWTRTRRRIMAIRQQAGVDDRLLELHRAWLGDLGNARVLDLGCFDGNKLSLWIAERAAEYEGIDLSDHATQVLDDRLRAAGLTHARARAMDFLDNPYPDDHFDYIYAYSVLHHFRDMTVLLKELHRVLKPGGRVISMDPLQTEPLNRLARTIYRPLQSDTEWEWPFTRRTIRNIQCYFDVEAAQGLQGAAKLGYPLQIIPGLGGLGRRLSHWGLSFDERYANRLGIPFYLCWHTTMLLRKPTEPPPGKH